MSDDWKGEHLLQIPRPNKFEKAAEASRIMNSVHKRRREARGERTHNSAEHSAWARWALVYPARRSL